MCLMIDACVNMTIDGEPGFKNDNLVIWNLVGIGGLIVGK